VIRLGRGAWKGRVLRPSFDLRPTSSVVREAVLSMLGPGRLGGAVVWDLCCGSGAVGLECMSCGASRAIFVDSDRRAVSFVRKSADELGAGGSCTAILGDVSRLEIDRLPAPGVVFVDPPYGCAPVYSWAQSIDWLRVLSAGGAVFVEAGGGDDMPRPAWQSRRYGGTWLFWQER